MAWVKFTADYDHREPGFTVAYKDGWTGNVLTAHVDAAVAAGKAVRLRKVSKDAAPEVWVQPHKERVVDGWTVAEKHGPPVFLKAVSDAKQT